MSLVLIHCDGLCEPNPGGVACYGWSARDMESGKLITWKKAQVVFGDAQTTNNLAEYAALQNVLTWLCAKVAAFVAHTKEVVLRTDSQLVVNQVRGRWKCNSPTLGVHLTTVRGLLDALKKAGLSIRLEWVPREQNCEADELSRRAYFETTGEYPPERGARRSKTPTPTSS